MRSSSNDENTDDNDIPNGTRKIQTSIPEYEVTVKRKPYIPTDKEELHFKNPSTARVNLAATSSHPDGTTTNNYAKAHASQTVLQQHCAFFDYDNDGIIWPSDTYRGFRELGFNIFLSLLSMFIIHVNFSYPSCPSLIPDPFFRLYLLNIHKTKHGSDTGTYDNEGRFVPQKFEDFFSKYGDGEKDGLTAWEIWEGIKGQRVIMDPIGWGGAVFEWVATYLFLWPEDGIVRKEDVRRIYDGSLFYEIAEKRTGRTRTRR
ncbi:Caleosin-domain-containing protein [Wilcoxina mikolae CBS 423.85]|nr:Caleosin-domain-containing protein [Wilcoxina mikolae CBS 423.85]